MSYVSPYRYLGLFLLILSVSYGSNSGNQNVATFDGESRLSYDVTCREEYRKSDETNLKFRFRTNVASGLMMYTDGYLGDYMAVELVNNRIHIHINLGSTDIFQGKTTIKAGSLLDDNVWHEVMIDRRGRAVNVTLDGVSTLHYTNGGFERLDLDRPIHFGGVDSFLNPIKPMESHQNFSGCLSDLWFNSVEVIKDFSHQAPCITGHGSVETGDCEMTSPAIFGFPTPASFLTVARQHTKQILISLESRSFTTDVLLVFHQLMPSGHLLLTFDNVGNLFYTMQVGDSNAVTDSIPIDSSADSAGLSDGRWHTIQVEAHSANDFATGNLDITVDRKTVFVNHDLQFSTTSHYYVGGSNHSVHTGPGFVGCVRNLAIQGELVTQVDSGQTSGVTDGTCPVEDRCVPNPCEHGGLCSQDYQGFTCNCSGTGYTEATCHRSRFPSSCALAQYLDPDEWKIHTWIDLDGSGPMQPFQATCIYSYHPDTAETEIHHDSEEPTRVDGCQEAGCYRRPVQYGDMDMEQLEVLVGRASSCKQYVKYKCHSSRLLADPGHTESNLRHYGWLVGRHNTILDYWGGASPKSGMCACGLQGDCLDWTVCNCDAGRRGEEIFDDGFLTHKEDLPVTELRFGDTGALGDSKWGEHTLGPLLCKGDSLADNTVTFRKEDGVVELPTFTWGDIQFYFKTTQKSGIFLQDKGVIHFIELMLMGDEVHFRLNVGEGNLTLVKRADYPLYDDQWHSVYMEINTKQATLQVDQEDSVSLDIPLQTHGFRLALSSALVVGAAVDYEDGYVGCIRRLLVNGVVADLRGMVERGEVTYGLSAGCQTKCASAPCLHGGQCVEAYSHYTCDCTNTPLTGHDCGKEVGVQLTSDRMITLELSADIQARSTMEERIVVGFSTVQKGGLLMMITNGDLDNHEYISVSMNNNGGVKVALSVGFERDEVNTDIQDVDLANQQTHVVVVQRSDEGRSLSVAVDDYPVLTRQFNLPPWQDTALDKPRYVYIGKTEATGPGDGFRGCIFRAEFNGVFPIKEVFASTNTSTVTTEGGPLIESTCREPEVLSPTEEPEYRT